MISEKLGSKIHAPPPPNSKPSELDCCMCGDYGFSFELFHCQVCQFRSQHRYCSNQYPKAETYEICNWCLSTQKDDQETKDKSQHSSTSNSSMNRNTKAILPDSSKSSKLMKVNADNCDRPKGQRRTDLQLKLSRPVKKQRSPVELPSPTGQKKTLMITSDDRKLRRTVSEEISSRSRSSGVTKHVFRNRVRRYKLLDEVSS